MTSRARRIQPPGISRRHLLAAGLGSSLVAVGRNPLAHALERSRGRREDGLPVLVVLQLTGGNDGLNTVVPHRQDAYYRLRPTLGLARQDLHPLDDDHGLHPAASGLGELFQEGRLAVLHGVGGPRPERSHFRSLEIWHTAEPEAPAGEVGWLGRLVDQLVDRDPEALAALSIGRGDLLLSLRAERTNVPTLTDPAGLRVDERARAIQPWRDRLLARESESPELAFLRGAARTTYDAAARMQALRTPQGAGGYPATDLARGLRLVAELVAGRFGTRIFHLERGGFDTHARQAPTHAALIGDVSASLTAFQRDLEERGVAGDVVTLVFSDFGRRAQENGSRGTDHGFGAPVFLLGAPVRGGQTGTAPDVEALVDGDVPATTDFRRLYTTLERDWMGLRPGSPEQRPLPILGA